MKAIRTQLRNLLKDDPSAQFLDIEDICKKLDLDYARCRLYISKELSVALKTHKNLKQALKLTSK